MPLRRVTGRSHPRTLRCPRCGVTSHLPDARFCGQCGASLLDAKPKDDLPELPRWQRPSRARYSHVAMARMALSCPECGEPMRFGFRHICRRCGARLVMVPRFFHPNHVRVYVAGPRAALADLMVEGTWFIVAILILAALGKACAPLMH